jgi:regulator of nucleoside diphosphate kinase
MNPISNFNLSPDIVLGREQHRRLLLLALEGTSHSAEETDWLLHELERAMVVADHAVPGNVVRMGSTVRFRSHNGGERVVELVFPKEADIGSGRISIMTPVGTALIGLREGQSISYRTRDDRRQALTILEVTNRPDDDPGPIVA